MNTATSVLMKPVAAPVVQTNPFPGLRPFHEDEEHLFFGRENQVDAMVDKLASTRFVAVVGTSGSGKSSLVNCGLRPALHGGLMARAGTAWRTAQFRPGSDPMRAMARALAKDGVMFRDYQAGGLTLAEIVDTTLRMSKLGLIDIYEQANLGEDVNLLVVVDQFEELFRYRQLGAGQQENVYGVSEAAAAFVNLLLEVKAQTTYPIYVVLTMRSDFLGDCTQFPGLAEAINAGQYLVPRLTRDERRAAISGPVGVGGAEISTVLLTRLVNDVGDNPDQLSILQHALNRTWARWQNEGGSKGPLDLVHYEAIGTMVHALDQHAERAYAELGTTRQQQICEKLFKALTDKANDRRGVRRPTTLGTLCALADATAAEVTEVIDVFRKPSRSFLMPPAGEALEPETMIDISHESLMRVWQRLITWADEEAQSAQMYRRLADAAALHTAGKASLWGQPELGVALAWRGRQSPNQAWARRYHSEFAQAMDFLDGSYALTLAMDAANSRRKRTWATVLTATFLVMLMGALNWVVNDLDEISIRSDKVRQATEDLRLVGEMRKLYTERARGLPPARLEDCTNLDERGLPPGSLFGGSVKKDLCDEAKRVSPELGSLLDVFKLVENGDIIEATKVTMELPGRFAIPAYRTMETIAEMQSPEIRQERRVLVELQRQTASNQSTGRRQKGSGATAHAHAGDSRRYEHPIHRAIADKLQAGTTLDIDERRLLKTYEELEHSAASRAATLIRPGRVEGAAEADQPQPEPYQPGDGASTASDSMWLKNASWVYMRVAHNARQPESKLAAMYASVRETIDEVGWFFIVPLIWPLWRFRRWWQRRSGESIMPKPNALRRALATLVDLGIGLGIFVLLATMTDSASTIIKAKDDTLMAALAVVVFLSLLSYLLFCDAIRFKYCRSIGKILFNLRPVRDVAEDRRAIGLAASAKRNGPLIIGIGIALGPLFLSDKVSDGFSAAELVFLSLVLSLVLWWFYTFLFKGGRTLGDRWSGTRVIDADCEESLRIDAPSRYIRPDPGQAPLVAPRMYET